MMVSEKQVGVPLVVLTIITGWLIYTQFGQVQLYQSILTSLFLSTFVGSFVVFWKEVWTRLGF